MAKKRKKNSSTQSSCLGGTGRSVYVDVAKLDQFFGRMGDRSIAIVAKELKITNQAIYNWLKTAKIGNKSWAALVELFGKEFESFRITTDDWQRQDNRQIRFPSVQSLQKVAGLIDTERSVRLSGVWSIDLQYIPELGIESLSYPKLRVAQEFSVISISSEEVEPSHDISFTAGCFIFQQGTKIQAYYQVLRKSTESFAQGGSLLTASADNPDVLHGNMLGSNSHYPGKDIIGKVVLSKVSN